MIGEDPYIYSLNLTYVKHKPSSRMIVLVIIVFSPFLSLKTVLLEIYFMN